MLTQHWRLIFSLTHRRTYFCISSVYWLNRQRIRHLCVSFLNFIDSFRRAYRLSISLNEPRRSSIVNRPEWQSQRSFTANKQQLTNYSILSSKGWLNDVKIVVFIPHIVFFLCLKSILSKASVQLIQFVWSRCSE